MTDLIDVSPYVSPPRFTGPSGVFLARAVLQAAPAECALHGLVNAHSTTT